MALSLISAARSFPRRNWTGSNVSTRFKVSEPAEGETHINAAFVALLCVPPSPMDVSEIGLESRPLWIVR